MNIKGVGKLIPNQKVKLVWRTSTKNHYVNKGYTFTNFGNQFEVDIKDLSSGSSTLVKYICDYCNGNDQVEVFKSYKKILISRKTTPKDCCSNEVCRTKKRIESMNIKNPKQKKTVVIKPRTFAEKYPELLPEWNYSKNKSLSINDEIKMRQKIWWKCASGHEWETKLANRKHGRKSGCPYCSGIKTTYENSLLVMYPDIAREWHPSLNKDLTPSKLGKHSGKKVWWLCKNGHEWKSVVNSRTLLGYGCPICNFSKGEKRIEHFLNLNKQNYKYQYEFLDLKGINGGFLRFDFAVFNNNNSILTLIEYDGEFHFGEIYKGDGYERTKIHDQRKNEYCKLNNIPLLRIPYWEFDNIEKILTQELIKCNFLTPS